eukprot:Blabericola_migrator_1__10924@NODE_6310_length_562_cov_12_549495_g4273_i0_p1_GENE_NODE_6310_length_562_cov_12_549495_g4273_i0NODE_6310_length_562_cov_12_549495_g4273_i0_p1_ORF_typecomplete_len117_score2_73RT_RNaseH/PF17917_1/4_4e27RT_RNaseH_2/PF17919_1/1_3e12RVT_3/PF13456_6/0_00045Shikimate_dh_N/PF08501_11/0_26_NODE_6310_length_562_cov_12_549495_g4273_i0108458
MQQGKERIIAYMSRRLLPRESRYPTHERELLAIVEATKHWKHLLQMRRVLIRTDHKPLLHLPTQKSLSDRMFRWMAHLADFDLAYEHIAGDENTLADLLSRPVTAGSECISFFLDF